MLAILNRSAKMPTDLAAIARDFKVDCKNLLSTNPKTKKSKVQTYILHLAPADTSGINVCPGAGNCRNICLHFAGNPVYMQAKQAARIRRTLAYAADPKRFMRLILCAILAKMNKHQGEKIAIRLNGTSDIAFETIDFFITDEFARFCRVKFGAIVPVGQRNIFEIFNLMGAITLETVPVFYDYTKIKHNWAECKRLGYHLTFSFDGRNNGANLKLCREALFNGINVAAAFNIKRNQQLPLYIDASKIFPSLPGEILYVQDGDLSDFRPGDTNGGSIIGLRFKLPHGAQWSEADKLAFCLG